MNTRRKCSKFPYKCVYVFNASAREGGFMTIIMENSGIYKKRGVQMVCNGDGPGSALCVRTRFFSKPHQRGSQEPYQSPRPPCEMSSRSGRLWDCCRHPNSLWMSASLTGQLAYTALLTTQQHFQLLFFNFHAFFFKKKKKGKKKLPANPDTAPLNGKKKTTDA